MKRKELEKLPVLRATTAMLKQAEKRTDDRERIFPKKNCAMNTSTTPDAKRFDRILKVASI